MLQELEHPMPRPRRGGLGTAGSGTNVPCCLNAPSGASPRRWGFKSARSACLDGVRKDVVKNPLKRTGRPGLCAPGGLLLRTTPRPRSGALASGRGALRRSRAELPLQLLDLSILPFDQLFETGDGLLQLAGAIARLSDRAVERGEVVAGRP